MQKTKDKFANMWYYKRSQKISEIKKTRRRQYDE